MKFAFFLIFFKKSYNSIPKLFDLTKNENPLSYHFPLSYSKPNWDRLALRTIGNLSLVDTEQKKLSNYSAWMQIQTCVISFKRLQQNIKLVSKLYGKVGVISWLCFHLVLENYILYWDFDWKSWIVDYFFHYVSHERFGWNFTSSSRKKSQVSYQFFIMHNRKQIFLSLSAHTNGKKSSQFDVLEQRLRNQAEMF